jgi:hypothetical protein
LINEDTPYKLAEIIRDTWPNLFRKPISMEYKVQTWDEEHHTVNYHTVRYAISYEHAKETVEKQYPNQKVIAVEKVRAIDNQLQ